MGVGAEDVLVCVSRFLHFSMKTSSVCAQKHPIVIGALLFLFLLYVFFNIFVFFSPFLVCVALLLRIFYTSGGLIILEAKERSNPCKHSGSVGVVYRDESSCLLKQKSRRTNVKRIEWDTQAKAGKDLPLRSPNDLVSKTMLLAKEVKALNMRQKERAFDHGESSSAKRSSVESIVFDDDHSILDSDRDILSSSSSDDESEKFEGGRKEEAAQQDGTKAVQWTDDDQRNLLDLGLSEIERNKRLESLIARRRARKLFKMQIEKGLIDLDTILPSQIAPLYIARNNPYIAEMDGMETPGSAPSVMFPAKNPFDLPYDPLEEKPDLKTDSFQQEFTTVTQRDMLYCRHESFCYGAAYPLEPRKRALDGLGFSRFKKQSSNAEFSSVYFHVPEIASVNCNVPGCKFFLQVWDLMIGVLKECCQTKESTTSLLKPFWQKLKHQASPILSISEVVDSETTTPNQATTLAECKDEKSRKTQKQTDTEGMRKMKNDQNVAVMSTRSEARVEQQVTDDSNDESTSSEEDERRYTAAKSGYSQHAASRMGRAPPKPLNCSLPSPSNEKSFFYPERGPCHTPTCSIASDLQVEVSDIGSPPLTVDGANSPTDRESLNLDGDFEREYMWAASSSQSSRMEENEPKFRDMRGLNEEDLANMASLGHSMTTKDVAESTMQLQQPDELDDTYSLSSTITGLQADSRTHSMSLEDVRQVVEEVGKPSISGLSNAPSPVNQAEKLESSEKLVALPKGKCKSPPKPTEEANIIQKITSEDASLKGTEPAAELKTPANEISSVFQKATNLKNTDKTANVKQKESESARELKTPIGEFASVQKKAADTPGELKKAAEEIGSVSQEVSEAPLEVEKPTEKIDSDSKEVTEAPAKLKKEVDKVESSSQEATMAATELKKTDEVGNVSVKSVEAPTELKNSTEEVGSVLQKSKEASAELRKSVEETAGVSQKAAVAPVELKKSNEESIEAPSTELKTSVEGIASVSEKSAEAASDLKKSAEESGTVTNKKTEVLQALKEPEKQNENLKQNDAEANADVRNKATEVPSKVKDQDEDTGSSTEMASKTAVKLKNPATETGSVSEIATGDTAETNKSSVDTGSVSQNATRASAELKIPAELSGSIPQKEVETPAEITKTVEDIANVSHKASEVVAELKSPAEKSENTTGKTKEVAAMLKSPAEEAGNVSQRETEVAAEMKETTDEIGTIAQKAKEAATELKHSAQEINNVTQDKVEAPAEMKQPVEEIKT
ncbi:LOW QUALITY PROTEIN: uncharacterized protein LOC126787460 [Argentina anserina]|uniref:LOW QUALITY PROTEIN: uncharacterized protein LOC126787460 n=1 Tax=Argentina anserina TaxID=57926 RepID=UPI0021764E76|nr:LOW QUALITY PROTEIN: uncharacterized protein LOC126787460 [Potentilla anserina]